MVLVTGATGFVGQKVLQTCKDAVACPSLRNVSEEDVRRMVEMSGADVIIHTAAISDIGMCQQDPEASYLANVQIPVYLARAANTQNSFASARIRFTAVWRKKALIRKMR